MTGIEHQIDFITLLLKVLAVLLGVIATGFGWWATGLSKDVKALIIQKLDCNTQYANKNDNAESHHREKWLLKKWLILKIERPRKGPYPIFLLMFRK